MKFTSKKPHFEHLRKKWTAKSREASENLFENHLGRAALGSLGGLMLLTTPAVNLGSANMHHEQSMQISGDTNNTLLLAAELKDKLPGDVRKLSVEEEKAVEELLTKKFGFKVVGELEGKRLNRTYGVIGGEQHLYRYPGDSVAAQMKSAQDWAMYGPAGIAPGLGAFGYFTSSKDAMTQEDVMREKYYLAVQTFLSPGYAERVKEYRDFYKYRKMVVVNPKTGQAVVAVIGDAGPAEWTGKHLGGSPEVMHELGLASGSRKGEVLYFFIEDPENVVPLGPIDINSEILAKRS